MGDEEKIDTMLKSFFHRHNFTGNQVPQFNREHGYFMIQKNNRDHEEVSDAWEGFVKGWFAREDVDDRTVRGW